MDELKAAAQLKARMAELNAAEAAAELQLLEQREREDRAAQEQHNAERVRRLREAAGVSTPEPNGHSDRWAAHDPGPGPEEIERPRGRRFEPARGTDPVEPSSPPAAAAARPAPALAAAPRESSLDDTGAPGLLVLWYRKWTVLLITLLLGCAFGGVYFLLPERYDSTVRLEARSSGKQSSFEFLQASQILARTYSEVARSRVIADLVARRLPFARSKSNILDDVSVVTVSDTPLIKITATQEKGSDARRLADVYSSTLLRYVDRQSRADAGSLTLVHAAESPTRAGPGLPLMVGLGCLLGLLLGVTIAFFQERLASMRQ